MVFRFIFLSLLLMCGLPWRSSAQHAQLVVNLTDPHSSGFLSFENPKGSIKVTGYDGNVILVNATQRFIAGISQEKTDSRNPGLKPFELSAEEKNNRVLLICSSKNRTIDLDIKIPRQFSLNLISSDNGKIEVFNVEGEIEANNPGGNIELQNVSGSAILNSINGKIRASFRSVKPGSPMMFTSLEGNIEVYLPEKTNARIKMRSQNGTLFSDFNIKPVKNKPGIGKNSSEHIYASENWTVGILNNGGPEYILNAYNGNIYLKKARSRL